MKRYLIAGVLSLLSFGLISGVSAETSKIEGLTKREQNILARAAKKKNKNKNKNKDKKKDKAPGLEAVCGKVSNLSGLLLKKTAGGHIPRSDARYSGWSIICARNCVSFPAKAYHCDGSEAFKMGYYGRWSGNGKARGYCASGGTGKCSVSNTRKVNKQKKCNGAAYLKTGKNSCMRFNINVDRNGGV